MKYTTIYTFDPTGVPNNELQEKSDEIVLKDLLKYPNNSIEHKRIYEEMFAKIDRIPITELEEFLNKYN